MKITFNPSSDADRVQRALELFVDAPFKLRPVNGRFWMIETDDPKIIREMEARDWKIEAVEKSA